MIEYSNGDILRSNAQAIINTVNCVGVMGRGLALQFKKAYPDNFKAYADACLRYEVVPGKMFVFEPSAGPKWIINFPTKRHWKDDSRMEDIESGLADLVRVIQEKKIESIAIPALGVGLGNLPWEPVRQRIEKALGVFPELKVLVYPPKPFPFAASQSFK